MKGKLIVLVAMRREAEALGLPCTIIGIGAKSMPYISKDDVVVNVGYCGAYGIPVGTIVEPIVAIHENVFEEVSAEVLAQHFDFPKVACFTADDFVTQPMSENPAVYDMELAHIASRKCKKLYCLKIVSDNLNEADCESFDDADAWAKVRNALADVVGREVVEGTLGREVLAGWPITV